MVKTDDNVAELILDQFRVLNRRLDTTDRKIDEIHNEVRMFRKRGIVQDQEISNIHEILAGMKDDISRLFSRTETVN